MTTFSVEHIPLFENVSPETLTDLFARAEIEEHPPDIVLFREGVDMPRLMYVILSGKVDLFKKNSDGNDEKFLTLQDGQVLGEMAMFDNLKRSAMVVVKERARLLKLQQPDFDWLFRERATDAIKILQNLIKILSFRVRDVTARLIQEKIKELEALEFKRKTEELEYARKVQLSMLPKDYLELEDVEIAAKMMTATEVGGDYYDFIDIGNDMYVIACGDAVGHGMAAGLIVGMAKVLLVSASKSDLMKKPLEEVMTSFNDALREAIHERGLGMSLTVGLLNMRTKTVKLTSLGMPLPLYFNAAEQTMESIDLKCPPLGFLKSIPVQTKELELKKNDVLIFWTDGFAERFNKNNRMWGYEAATDMLYKICKTEQSAVGVAEKFFEACNGFAEERENLDDMTIVALRFK